MTINIMRINFFISANHSSAVKKLDNGLDEYLFKLSESIFTVKFIKKNFSTFHDYIYLIIEVRFKIRDSWYIAKALLNLDAERNFIL
jgi:hypothetical protein